MVASYTVDTVPVAGKKAYSETVIGPLTLKTGTWTADGDVTCTIVTGLTNVIGFGTNVDTGTVTSEHCSKPNVNGAGAAVAGDIGIVVCAVDNVGTWFALGY
jgi:hypothetical protein